MKVVLPTEIIIWIMNRRRMKLIYCVDALINVQNTFSGNLTQWSLLVYMVLYVYSWTFTELQWCIILVSSKLIKLEDFAREFTNIWKDQNMIIVRQWYCSLKKFEYSDLRPCITRFFLPSFIFLHDEEEKTTEEWGGSLGGNSGGGNAGAVPALLAIGALASELLDKWTNGSSIEKRTLQKVPLTVSFVTKSSSLFL